jgi:hypothetical protein
MESIKPNPAVFYKEIPLFGPFFGIFGFPGGGLWGPKAPKKYDKSYMAH